MKTVIELMMEADMAVLGDVHLTLDDVERLIQVVRADEREAACDIVDWELDSNGHAEAIKIAIRARSNT